MTFVNATSTNLFSVNATSTNLITTSATSTNFYSTLINAITAAFTNFTATNATTTNLIATNATSTNFFSALVNATTAAFTTLSTTGTTTLATAGGRVGIGTTTPNHTLDVQGNIGLSPSGYVNFGTVDSTSGYGLRDNSGTIEYKNSNGGWTSFASAGAGGGQLLAVYSTSTAGTNITVNFNGSSNSSPSYSGGVLTLPSNASHIVVETWGAGGGGGGSGGSAGNGAAGGDTCFGTNATACTTPVVTASGGSGGGGNGGGNGSGGTGVSGDINLTGSSGGGFGSNNTGTATGYGSAGVGGSSPRGGGGATSYYNSAGNTGSAYGGGGSGGGCNACTNSGNGTGGGGGGYAQKLITSPSGAYYYTIGAGGGGGAAGAGQHAGGAGGTGGITISVYTSGVSNGSVGSGLTGYLPFYNSAGTNLSATSSIFLSTTGNVGIGTTSPISSLFVQGSGSTSPFTVASSTGATLFSILANGNVGIGTSTPGSKLDIWGNLTVGTSSTPTFFANAAIGNVGIGTASPDYKLTVIAPASNWGIAINPDNPSSGKQYGLLSRGTTYSGYFNGPGFIDQAAWTYGSDRRLKENISYFENGLDIITKLKPAAYDYISGTKSNLGFIAQDVQEVIPEAVSITDPTTGMLGLKTEFIIPYLVNSIQNMNSVFNASNALNASSTIFSYYQGTTTPAITVGTTGNVAIATSSSMYALTVGNPIITGVVARFQNATGYCDINPTTTSLTCSSDERLKKNILSLDATSTFDKFMQLNPVTYNWIAETASSSPHAGFIAQQVEALFPDLVATDDAGMKSVSYAGFIPYIVQSIKEIIATLSSFKESFTTNNVHTKNLCVGETCITEAELKALLQQSNVSTPSAPAPTETSTTTSSVVATTTDEIIIDETATSTTETSIEPLPEAVVEPSTATSTEETPTE